MRSIGDEEDTVLVCEQFGEAIHQVVKKAAGDWRKRKKSEQLRGIFMQVQRATRVERECERERRQKRL